ncbi:unnamed protein product [Linum trigynum]|uniref:Uncharacterized protein n=1 Tax=Linum trigynum TaxID=586398 RepID=A0AAV2CX48_9ROSI
MVWNKALRSCGRLLLPRRRKRGGKEADSRWKGDGSGDGFSAPFSSYRSRRVAILSDANPVQIPKLKIRDCKQRLSWRNNVCSSGSGGGSSICLSSGGSGGGGATLFAAVALVAEDAHFAVERRGGGGGEKRRD